MKKPLFLFACISFVMFVTGMTKKEEFFKAIGRGDLSTIQILVEGKKVDVNVQDERGDTGLNLAVILDEPSIVEYLLKKGADRNIPGNRNIEPLESAISGRKLDIVKLLVTPENINKKIGPFEKTPLAVAIDSNSLEIVKYLLEKGADRNIPDKENVMPFENAIFNGNLDIVKLLVTPENINKKIGFIETTPLAWSAYRNKAEIVKYLLEKGADPSLKDIYGRTVLDDARYEFEKATGENKQKYKEIIDLLTAPPTQLISAVQKLTQALQALQITIIGG